MIKVIFGILLLSACKAQTPIIPLTAIEFPSTTGAYYKDTNNDLDPFVGTWQSTMGTTTFRMVIQKKYSAHDQYRNIYEDLLISEYSYIENGVEKVNTLNVITSPPVDPYDHNIIGNLILSKQHIPVCNDCLWNEKRVRLYFDDPTRNVTGLGGDIELRRVDENGVQKIKATLRQTGNIVLNDGQQPAFTSFNVLFGTYVLIKVN